MWHWVQWSTWRESSVFFLTEPARLPGLDGEGVSLDTGFKGPGALPLHQHFSLAHFVLEYSPSAGAPLITLSWFQLGQS